MAIPLYGGIDAALVGRLVAAAQFPQWRDLPVTPVEPGGWDNRTFRLGEALAARLPSAAGYAPQVAKEHRWLPVLAPRLPVAVPMSLAMGKPGEGYRWPWSVRRWIAGTPADDRGPADTASFGAALAGFLRALHAIDGTGGPKAGAHSFHRGGSLAVYDGETRASIEALRDRIDVDRASRIWETARRTRWDRAPLWVHGDIAAGNLLVDEAGRLSAVIDFGCMAIGDPACDLVIAWTGFDPPGRRAFRAALPHLDDDCWDRAKGWALWKAVITRADPKAASPAARAVARRTLEALAEDGQ